MGYSRAIRHACAVAAVVGLASPAAADLTKTDKVVGDWHIYSEVDPMTDQLRCAAFYQDGTTTHLSPKGLHLNFRGRGAWQRYRYRIGEGRPILGMPANAYADPFFITIKGRDFRKAIEAGRIRVEVTTYTSGVFDEDIDLTEAAAAIDAMAAMGCQ